ncbi:membrane progestin receptor gamma-like isoform X2 [Anneissia japonica]|uniref:membrane progestin receptor gamma-like isoform X2 n=1 Tax=Anneissia japonica TaxID=1529436 RepID=UPI0014257359|nr:membrane progestin receptor gamma-like isoform X2 [Anneissia japonica]
MWTVKLFSADQLPSVFHEPFILNGYRASETSVVECIKSTLQCTNETVNFWTHFVPFLYTVWRIVHLRYYLDFVNDPFTWPLLGLLICISLCLSASCFAHLFNCLSERACHICYFFDYSSLGIYSLASCIAYRYYVFPHCLMNTEYFNIYIPIGALNAILWCTFGACWSRFMNMGLFRHLFRLSVLIVPYVFCSLPLLYRVFVCPDKECEAASVTVHRQHFVAAFCSAFIFATHLPERLAPGKFDVFLHSHQLFHVITATGTILQVNSVIIDMNDRRAFLESEIGLPTYWYSLGLITVVFSLQMLLILCFSVWVYSRPEESKHIYPKSQNTNNDNLEPCAETIKHKLINKCSAERNLEIMTKIKKQ